jgi:DNA-binding XRE family transcriptional regulator
VEHREAELRAVTPRDLPDDPARFLRELRQLRDGAGLGQAELAARAHYPREAIRAAEAGPALPDLPVLSAYVQACGGPVTDWEERWRTLTRSPALTLLPTRTAGCSDAAAAGARIGSVSLAADGHDPSIIMAALGRVANGITAGPPAERPAPFGVPEQVSAPAATATTMRAPTSVLGTAAPAAVPASPAPVANSMAAAAAAASSPSADAVSSPPGRAASSGWTPSVVPPASAAGRTTSTRRSAPSKTLIAVLVIVVCLVALGIALF